MICDLVYLLKSLHQTCLPITVTLSLANGLCPNIWTLPSLHARGCYKRKFVYPEMHQSKPKVYHCNIAKKNSSYTVFENNQNCFIRTFRSISYLSRFSNIWIFATKYTLLAPLTLFVKWYLFECFSNTVISSSEEEICSYFSHCVSIWLKAN